MSISEKQERYNFITQLETLLRVIWDILSDTPYDTDLRILNMEIKEKIKELRLEIDSDSFRKDHPNIAKPKNMNESRATFYKDTDQSRRYWAQFST